MSFRMYKPDRQSKINFYVLFFFAVAIGVGIYVYTRPLAVETACSEVSLKTSNLTKDFNYDPLNNYDLQKADCIDNVLSKK